MKKWQGIFLLLSAVILSLSRSVEAQSPATTVSITSPKAGATVVQSTLALPFGSAASSSGVRDVVLLLQRNTGTGILCWDGHLWSNTTAVVSADYNALSHSWQWPMDVALPSGKSLAQGRYRLQAVARAANHSIIGRTTSDFAVQPAAGLTKRDAPSNDNVSRAIRIEGESGTTTGTNVGATGSPTNPNLNDVWWRWHDDYADGQVTFDTTGSTFDTYLQVFEETVDYSTAPPTATLMPMGSDDNGGGGTASQVTFSGKFGSEYVIAVSGMNGQSGDITLNWARGQVVTPTAPANDNIANAIPISGVSGSVTGTSVGATGDWPDSNNPAANVWWVWTSPGNGTVSFNATGSNFATYINAYSSTKALITARAGSISFMVAAGQRYFISVSGVAAAVGDITLNWNTSAASAPANDLPSRATTISGAAGTIAGTTVGANGEGIDNAKLGGPNVWYAWTAPGNGAVTFDTKGSGFDTFLRVFAQRMDTPSTFDFVGQDDDSGGAAAALLKFNAVLGKRYLISVGSRYSESGAIKLNWTSSLLSGPTNDLPQNATAISGLSGSVAGTNVGAHGEGPTGTATDMSNVWWKWTPPRPGAATFDTKGSAIDTVLRIYRIAPTTGTQVQILNVGEDDNGGGGTASQLIFDATPGTSAGSYYLISVASKTSATGAIRLNWSLGAPADVTGFVRDKAGRGMADVLMFLVSGDSIDPILFDQVPGGPIQVTHTTANGSYGFSGLKPGKYSVVPAKPGTLFSPRVRVFTKTTTSTPFTTVDFSALGTDILGPVLSDTELAAGDETANGIKVPGGVGGAVIDASGISGQRSAGVLYVGFYLQKLKGDAASLKLAPSQRGVLGTYSKRSRGFVSTAANAVPMRDSDKVFLTSEHSGHWSSVFDADVEKALASPGTYRIVTFAIDAAFNYSLNSRTSMDPDVPAGAQVTYLHFEEKAANMVVTRTLPISAPNGKFISYLISVTNTGDLPLQNVSVIQTLNTQKTVLVGTSISPRPAVINAYGIIWKFATIGAHSSQVLSLQVEAKENNPFGSNIAAGQLDVSSSGGVARFAHDQINIESSTWLIGGALNALRGLGDAIGRGFNYVFNSSVRDQRAQADLNTIKAGTGVTRVTGADVLTFGNGALLVASGGGNVLAIGPSNLVASGGGNLVASGGGNLVASGGGNLIAISGIRASNILNQLINNPASLLASNSPFAPALLGANLVASGGGNLVASGGGNLVASGGGNLLPGSVALFVDNNSGLLAKSGLQLLSQDGGGLISTKLITQDGGGLISQDGGGAINLNGTNLLAGKGNSLISDRGGSLVASGGGNLISQDGGG